MKADTKIKQPKHSGVVSKPGKPTGKPRDDRKKDEQNDKAKDSVSRHPTTETNPAG